MFDVLPFPRIIGDTPEKQIGEILSYLIQFKETLEFALANITEENLSPNLVSSLNGSGANVSNGNTAVKFSVNFNTGCLEYTIY